MAKSFAPAVLFLICASMTTAGALPAEAPRGANTGLPAEAPKEATPGLPAEAPIGAKAGPMTDIERQRLLSHMEMTSTWLIDEVSGLSAAQLAFRRAPEEWSIAQVIDHLLVVSPIYWADLQAAVKSPPMKGETRNTDADLLWYGIDRTFREKAIPTEVPKGEFKSLAAALAEYRTHHDRLVQYVKTTKDDLRSRMVPRQGSDAYQWALLISTHEQRHILQIRAIKADKRFPGR